MIEEVTRQQMDDLLEPLGYRGILSDGVNVTYRHNSRYAIPVTLELISPTSKYYLIRECRQGHAGAGLYMTYDELEHVVLS